MVDVPQVLQPLGGVPRDRDVKLKVSEDAELIVGVPIPPKDGSGPKEPPEPWLKGKPDLIYRKAVKQALMIAAAKMRIDELTQDHHTKAGESQKEIKMLEERSQGIKSGAIEVAVPAQGLKRVKEQQFASERSHSMLMKKSKTSGCKRERGFKITAGTLQVFRSLAPHSRLKHEFDVSLCSPQDYFLEQKGKGSPNPPFDDRYSYRIHLRHEGRKHGPMMLYTNDKKEADKWMTSIKMSKYLHESPENVAALQTCIRRISSSVLVMGWQELFRFYKEAAANRAMMRQFAMRLMKANLSRGWNKLRTMYRMKKQQLALREKQKDWVLQFFKDKLHALSHRDVKRPDEIKDQIVMKTQNKFRQIRMQKIMQQGQMKSINKALTKAGGGGGAKSGDPATKSRIQQARKGAEVGICLEALSRKEVLKTVLDAHGLDNFKVAPEIFQQRHNTYSETPVPLDLHHLFVSDTLALLSFSLSSGGDKEFQTLSRAEFASFVRLDRVSSIILHSERINRSVLNFPYIPPDMQGSQQPGAGSWFTICGPKIAWCRRPVLGIKEQDENSKDPKAPPPVPVIGCTDGLIVGRELISPAPPKLAWMSVSFSLKDGSVPARANVKGQASGPPKTFVVVHLLGRQFQSAPQTGERVNYSGNTMEVAVPVSHEQDVDNGLKAFDSSEVCIDVIQVLDPASVAAPTKVKGAMPTPRDLLGPDFMGDASRDAATSPTRQVLWSARMPFWQLLYSGNASPGHVVSVSETLKSKRAQVSKKIVLSEPDVPPGGFIHSAYLSIEAQAVITQNTPPSATDREGRVCVSPEQLGVGPICSLMTSHNGAWYDGSRGSQQFQVDNVANFLELTLNNLTFPGKVDVQDAKKITQYYVEARCGPVCVMSSALIRPLPSWAPFLAKDREVETQDRIQFRRQKLFLPFSAGCWGAGQNARPLVDITIYAVEVKEQPAKTYGAFVAEAGKTGDNPPVHQPVYFARLDFQDMYVEDEKTDASLLLAKVRHEVPVPPVLKVHTGQMLGLSGDKDSSIAATGIGDNAELLMDVKLCDRRDVYETYTSDAIATVDVCGVLCVGDKCSLKVEEPLIYAQDDREFRRRFTPGEYSEARDERDPLAKPGRGKGPWAATLRDPCTSFELQASGLDHIPDYQKNFKVKSIPDFCTDILPHKYILPKHESMFHMQKRAGVYWRVMKDVAENHKPEGGKQDEKNKKDAPPVVVDRITHLSKDVMVTLIAVYPDKTCDVELTRAFMDSWKAHEYRQYAMPGNVRIHNFPNGSSRYILKRVPLNSVRPLHQAGVNIYDAGFGSTDAASDVDPSMYTKVYNPAASFNRVITGADLKTVGGSSTVDAAEDTRGGYCVVAGPVPPDSNPAVCQYEWCLHVRAPTDNDMYQFVQALRSVVRVGHWDQMHRLKEADKEKAQQRSASPPRQNLNAIQRAPLGGQLEVLLVEARHLVKPKIQKGATHVDALLGGAKIEEQMKHMIGESLNCFVNFRFSKNVNGVMEAMAYKGSKVQKSPVANNSASPSWGKMQELQSAGGWTFRTSPIDPEKVPDLEISLEVREQLPGMQNKSKLLGSFKLPVCENRLLCDPKAPFQNLWVPLEDEAGITTELGELHIMTRWVPNNRALLDVDQPSARAYWDRELRSIAIASTMREPVYSTMARLRPYNPNLQIAKGAVRPEEKWQVMVGDIEEITHGAPYLDCCEKRLVIHWNEFGRKLESENRHKIRLGEVRLLWLDEKEETKLAELNDLFHRGVPGMMRSMIWKAISLASRVEDGHKADKQSKGKDGEVLDDYDILVKHMEDKLTETVEQLNEDFANAALWEVSRVPEVVDLHYKRLREARNVCAALIAFSENPTQPPASANQPGGTNQPDATKPSIPNYSKEKETGSSKPNAVSYSNSLLVLAYYLLLPQTRLQASGEQKGMSQSDAFWLLYTLIGSPINASYHSYFGTPEIRKRKDPEPSNNDPNNNKKVKRVERPGPPIASKSGAMEDVFLFECCLIHHEKDLWIKLNSLGFQLHSLFHQIFMQLYAQFLPTASLFRFWDVLLFESTNPEAFPHPRHSLVDLAFGITKSQAQVLMNCESAQEARDCILSALYSQHDMQALMHMIQEANGFLWGGFSKNRILSLWHSGVDLYDEFYTVYEDQNSILKVMCHDEKLGDMPRMKIQSNTPGLRTEILLSHVMKVLQDTFGKDASQGEYSGVLRPVPHEIMQFGPAFDENLGSAARGICFNLFSSSTKAMFQALDGSEAMDGAVLYPISLVPGTRPEPTQLTREDWLSRIVSEVPNWTNYANEVYECFQDKIRKRMSLNELISSLIICSKGTAGMKALGLFNLYAMTQIDKRFLDKGGLRHSVPVSPVAVSIVSQREKGGFVDQIRTQAPPDKIDPAKSALHFQIFGHNPKADTLMGEIVIQSLTPFISTAAFPPEELTYPIWSLPQKVENLVQDLSKAGEKGKEVGEESDTKRLAIGDLTMGLKWIPGPTNQQNQNEEQGQLVIVVKEIKFEPTRVPNDKHVNPYITVLTYDYQGNAKKISRWDPRNIKDKVQTFGRGPYGGVIEFEKTMMQPSTHILTKFPNCQDMGHVVVEELRGKIKVPVGRWVWNSTWGTQLSTMNFGIFKDFLKMPSNQNVIHMRAVRIVVHTILTRALHHVSNRQAFLMADAVFSRSGAVPAILDAFLGPGSTLPSAQGGVSAIKAEMINNRWLNVSRQITYEWDRQVANNSGNVDLWPKWPASGVTLNDLRIRDAFPGQPKILWIRFARAGDGERGSMTINVDETGTLRKPEKAGAGAAVPIDMEGPTMLITKEEFITCMLGCPLLGESLRRMTSADHDVRVSKPLSLDVTVEDPEGINEGGADDILDLMNVKRTILLEVWDNNLFGAAGKKVSGDSFLGEAELPPLNSLTSQPRQIALNLRGAENTSRQDGAKSANPSQPVKGTLYCDVAWQMPADEVKDLEGEEAEDLSARAQRQEAMHTGKLTLKIKRAENLRRIKGAINFPGGSGFKDPTPTVHVHMRNDETMKWKTKSLGQTDLGLMEPMFKTKPPKSATINPTFDQEFSQKIMTGGYEARTHEHLGLGDKMYQAMSAKEKERYKQQQQTKTMDRGASALHEEVKIHFGESGQNQQGSNHKIPVYLHDTIMDFRDKLQAAAQEECNNSKVMAVQEKYKGVKVGNRHLVLVFVAPEKLRQMAQQGQGKIQSNEYKKTYLLSIADPSNWQPLDPLLTFNAYNKTFGFGNPGYIPLLRIVKNTPVYMLQNNRVRQFQEENRRYTEPIEILDNDRQCFAHAMYNHKHDANSPEWRPAIVAPAQDGAGGVRQFRVSWITTPKWDGDKDASGSAAGGQVSEGDLLAEEKLLLAPRVPKCTGGLAHPDHKVFLDQAREMYDKGITVQKIVVMLNEQLDKSTSGTDESGAEKSKPPPITFAEVKRHLENLDVSKAAGATGGATSTLESAAVAPKAASSSSAMPAQSGTSAPLPPPGPSGASLGPK